MFSRFLLLAACLALSGVAVPAAGTTQSDLDAFMERVLARRDENWKKLQQYVLEEREAFDLTGPGGLPLYGMRREYAWFIKQGIFVRSPVKANGVTLSEADRRKAEDEWIRSENRREARRKRREDQAARGDRVERDTRSVAVSPTGISINSEDVLRQGVEPQFVSAAYFLKFRFESGHYALAGREKVDGRDSLKIEYYPRAGLFNDDESNRNKTRIRERDKEEEMEDEIEAKMNKVSLVTIWVDPATHQILQYTLDDLDMDFLPGRALVRVDGVRATMTMGQPFSDVWLPRNIEMHFGAMLAVGAVDATYRVDYLNYKQADVTYKIK